MIKIIKEPDATIKAMPCLSRDLAKMVLAETDREELIAKAREVLDEFPEKFVVTVEGGNLSVESMDKIRQWLTNNRLGPAPMVIGSRDMKLKIDKVSEDG